MSIEDRHPLLSHRRDAVLEDAAWLMERGVDQAEAARRCGVKLDTLQLWLRQSAASASSPLGSAP